MIIKNIDWRNNNKLKKNYREINLLKFIFILFIINICLSHAHEINKKKYPNYLTKEEIKYIEETKKIRVHNESRMKPYNFYENKKAKGYSIDYINLLASKVLLNIEFVRKETLNDFFPMIKNDELDVLLNIVNTKERSEFLSFTSPYKEFIDTIYTRIDKQFTSLEALKGKTVALIKGHANVEFIRKNYPDINILITDNLDEMVKAVGFYKADAFVTIPIVATNTLRKLGMKIIPTGEALSLDNKSMNLNLSLATNKNNTILRDILQKAMNHVTYQEKEKIERKWLGSFSQTYAQNNQIHLSDGNKNYLKDKKQIKMCVNPKWMPFEYITKDGEFYGVFSDYAKLFSQKLKISFDLVKTDSNIQSMKYLKKGLCDVIIADVAFDKLKEDFLLSKTYFTSSRAYVTHTDTSLVHDISQLEGTIGILENSPALSILKTHYPEIKIKTFSNANIGLQHVASKDIIAFVNLMPALVYSIQSQGLSNLKIAGSLNSDVKISILINKELPQLVTILNKTIDSITQEENKTILDKWISVKYEKIQDYTILMEVVFVLSIIILLIYYRSRELDKINKKLYKLHQKLELKNTELTRLSNTDSLTGLLNRRRIDEYLNEQLNLYKRHGTAFSLILLDIDNFKLVNDSYGHDVGDTVLIEFSNIISQNIRNTDKVGRWGGEEFMIFCPSTTASETLVLAKKLKILIEKYPFTKVSNKTASFGVAQIEDNESLHMLFNRVDGYLYKAKENGRNQIVYKK